VDAARAATICSQQDGARISLTRSLMLMLGGRRDRTALNTKLEGAG